MMDLKSRSDDLALWAYLSDDAEAKLTTGAARLRPDEWAVNRQTKEESMTMENIYTVPGIPRNSHHTDPKTGERKVMELGG